MFGTFHSYKWRMMDPLPNSTEHSIPINYLPLGPLTNRSKSGIWTMDENKWWWWIPPPIKTAFKTFRPNKLFTPWVTREKAWIDGRIQAVFRNIFGHTGCPPAITHIAYMTKATARNTHRNKKRLGPQVPLFKFRPKSTAELILWNNLGNRNTVQNADWHDSAPNSA